MRKSPTTRENLGQIQYRKIKFSLLVIPLCLSLSNLILLTCNCFSKFFLIKPDWNSIKKKKKLDTVDKKPIVRLSLCPD